MGYLYGFNGKENDKDFGNDQLVQDYGFRIYNPAIGKFLSVDPLASSYPWNSTYAFAENTPIVAIDIDGLEKGAVASEVGKKTGTEITKTTATELSKRWVVSNTGTLTKVGTGLSRFFGSTLGVFINVLIPSNGGESDPAVQYHDDFRQQQDAYYKQFLIENHQIIYDDPENLPDDYLNDVIRRHEAGENLHPQEYQYLNEGYKRRSKTSSGQNNGGGEKIRLRHYTSNEGLKGIKDDMVIVAYDQNKVFTERARGRALSASDAAEKYKINKKDARNYIEFDVDANRVSQEINPLTGEVEYTIKGDVELDPKTTDFIKRN